MEPGVLVWIEGKVLFMDIGNYEDVCLLSMLCVAGTPNRGPGVRRIGAGVDMPPAPDAAIPTDRWCVTECVSFLEWMIQQKICRLNSLDERMDVIQPGGHMILSTTNSIEGKKAVKYLGLVSGDAILGANIFRDFFASIRDIVGGRSAAYEKELRKAKDIALGEMREQAKNLGANAIVGIDIDYETIGTNSSMLMVSASGTAVVLE